MRGDAERPAPDHDAAAAASVPGSKRSRARTVACVLFLSILFAGRAPAQSFKEYDLKAAFLYNFTQFVDWPPEAFAAPDAPFVIGVLGDDPFGKTLDVMVTNEVVKNRKLVIQRYRRVEETTGCQILFIGQSEQGRLAQILPALQGRSVLTVGETDTFAQQGGIVALRTEGTRIRLMINVDTAEAQHLTISSKVLRTATVVRGSGK